MLTIQPVSCKQAPHSSGTPQVDTSINKGLAEFPYCFDRRSFLCSLDGRFFGIDLCNQIDLQSVERSSRRTRHHASEAAGDEVACIRQEIRQHFIFVAASCDIGIARRLWLKLGRVKSPRFVVGG